MCWQIVLTDNTKNDSETSRTTEHHCIVAPRCRSLKQTRLSNLHCFVSFRRSRLQAKAKQASSTERERMTMRQINAAVDALRLRQHIEASKYPWQDDQQTSIIDEVHPASLLMISAGNPGARCQHPICHAESSTTSARIGCAATRACRTRTQAEDSLLTSQPRRCSS